MRLADLRKPSQQGTEDLREWRFLDRWRGNTTTTVLAWAGEHQCVLHEATCPHQSPQEPTAMGRMDEALELFEIEQPHGQFRYFQFCGHCLMERIPNYGWKPTPRDWELRDNLRQRLADMRILGEDPIPDLEMIKRMKRYGSGDITPAALALLVDFDKQQALIKNEEDLSHLVIIRRRRG